MSAIGVSHKRRRRLAVFVDDDERVRAARRGRDDQTLVAASAAGIGFPVGRGSLLVPAVGPVDKHRQVGRAGDRLQPDLVLGAGAEVDLIDLKHLAGTDAVRLWRAGRQIIDLPLPLDRVETRRAGKHPYP